MGRKRGGRDRGKPCTGTEPCDKVSHSARDGRALSNSTLEGVSTSTEGGGSVNGKRGEGLRNPLGVASGGKADDVEGKKLKLGGEAVKVFFFVLVKMSKNRVFQLGDIFNGKKIVKGKICAGVTRAIGRYGVIENMGGLDSSGEGFVDKGVKMGIESMEDRDWTFVSDTGLINKSSAGGFERSWKDASGENKRNKGVESVGPRGVETSKKIEGEAVVT